MKNSLLVLSFVLAGLSIVSAVMGRFDIAAFNMATAVWVVL